MRPSKIKAKLRRNEPALVTTCHFADPSAYELVSLMGFDGLWMDLEHHAVSLETANNLMRAARAGTADILARPAKGEFMRMGRILEAGAQGIMYGNLIQEFFTGAGSWAIGAALSVVMLLVTLVLVIVFLRLVNVRRVVT